MLDTGKPFDHITDPFAIHLARDVLSPEQVRALHATAPRDGFKRIEVLDPNHEKQYAMNLRYLVQDNDISAGSDDLAPEWRQLVRELRGETFLRWLEQGTSLELAELSTDIGIYTHDDGDYISIHKDKPNKAITAILYLNPHWPEDGGGAYEVRRSPDPADEPARLIPPRGGQFLAFPPTDRSWHSVSRVTTGGAPQRLTVQLEFWLSPDDRAH
ncbi:2OG-Fe(II) oxygenase [Actinokineospora soli]|uniref:2OG-Fe(II) oxygenase n=1 Tax=Actinokineospora soli TaxID=1048753 RepID=A0ABW2TSP9_9PSEU